jgi:hypothetical protein
MRTYGRANLAAGTLAYYARAWDLHISPRIGGLRLRDVNVELCQRLAADLVADGLGTAMRRKVLTILSAVLQRAFEWGPDPGQPNARRAVPDEQAQPRDRCAFAGDSRSNARGEPAARRDIDLRARLRRAAAG